MNGIQEERAEREKDGGSVNEGRYEHYLMILREELVPALGCTEPIAIAYCAAKARTVLGVFPERMEVRCSGNIIKNVKGVTVPNSGALKGLEAAALLGLVGGDAERELEVLEGITKEQVCKTKELLETKFCQCFLEEGVKNLYVSVKLFRKEHTSLVVIAKKHNSIVKVEKDGVIRSCLRLREYKVVQERKREIDPC